MAKSPDVLVVGGGVIGCSVAYYLTKAGVRVTVLERGSLGGEASAAAAGMLSPLAESHSSGPALDLGLQALALFPELALALEEETGVDIEFRPTGILRIAMTPDEAQELKGRLEWQSPLGMDVCWLTPRDALEREPNLNPKVCGAIASPREGQVNNRRLVEALAQGAARGGAEFRTGSEVTGLVTQGHQVQGVRLAHATLLGGHVVLAAGAWGASCGEWLDLGLPVRPVRGQMVALHAIPGLRRSVAFGANGYVAPKADGSLWVGGTMEEVGFDKRVTADGIQRVLEGGCFLVPSLKNASFLRAWSGLRPGSPDHMPFLGPVEGWEGISLALGHFRRGILLGPVTGQLIARSITDGDESPLKPFSLSRLAAVKRL